MRSKNEQVRRGRRFSRRATLGFAGVAVVLLLAAVLFFIPILGVSTVNVEGAKNADKNAVVEASGVRPGENMFRVDAGAAARAVAQVPWVEKVTVSRKWPTEIAISITEHEPLAFVMDGDNPMLVDAEGKIFLAGVKPEGIVEIANTEASDTQAVEVAAKAVAALVPEVRGQLERVEAPSAESVKLFFPEGRTVFWGSKENTPEKAEATRIVLQREGAQWNVSNPSMPTVR